MRRKIGFPSALFYFTDAPFWETFLENVGFEVIYSPLTNKEILEDGIRVTVTDACVPIKILHGHVMAIQEKVDYIFLPRYISMEKRETFCPKFLGLPDMVKASIPNLPEIIAPDIEFNKAFSRWRFWKDLANKTGASLNSVIKAYFKATKVHNFYTSLLHQGHSPQRALRLVDRKSKIAKPQPKGDLNIAVLGYPYQIHDPHISVNLIQHLRKLGVNIWTMEMVPEKQMQSFRNVMAKNHFWYFSNRVMWSLFYFLRKQNLDGVVHVTAFACGPDAMVDKFMELELKERKIPFIPVTIDEHSGEAGLVTRLEAFVDMIRHRRLKEC